MNPRSTTEKTPENANDSRFWNVFKRISSIAVPMALSFTFSFEVFLTIILLNQLNETEDEAAATTLITVMMNTLVVIGMSPFFGMALQASNMVGELEEAESAKQDEGVLAELRTNIGMINHSGLMLGALITPPVMLSMIFSKPLLVDVFRQDEHVSAIAQEFLRYYSPAVPALLSRISSEQLMFSFNRATPAMVMGLVNLGIGSGLSALLGFGLLGITKLGARGVAIGFVAESYLTALAYGLYLLKHKDFKDYHFFNILKRNGNQLKQLKELLGLSAPISFAITTEMAVGLSLGVFSGLIDKRSQSAMNYINQYSYFIFISSAAFSQTCAQEISRLIGAKRYHAASRSGIYGLITSQGYIIPIPILFAAAPKLLLLGNNNIEQELQDTLRILAPIMSSGMIMDNVRLNLLQQLRPLGDLKYSTLISVFGLGVGTTLAGVLGLKTNMGVQGIATGYLIGNSVSAVGLFSLWVRKVKTAPIKSLAENKLALVKEIEGKTKPGTTAVTELKATLFTTSIQDCDPTEKSKLLENKKR